MEAGISSNQNIDFLDAKDMADKRSSQLLSLWLTRTRFPVEGLRQKMIEDKLLDSNIKRPNFSLWFGKSRVTGQNSDDVGKRVVAIVEAIANFRRVSTVPIILPNELEEFITFYSDIPAKYRLQLRRLLHELQKESGQNYTDFFLSKDWRTQFSDWAIFGLVVDRLACIHAYSRYIMELAGLKEEDAKHWYWWHRLTLGTPDNRRGQHSLFALRGVYADEYYTQQMLRFLYTAHEHKLNETKRYETLIGLLNDIDRTGQFKRLWNQSKAMFDAKTPMLPQIPVPFFRPDKTFLWMLEVSAPIPQTDFELTARLATDDVESEYLADFRRQADEVHRGKSNALFIEDFAHHFSHDEKIALGLED
jgi:hypothetical protein